MAKNEIANVNTSVVKDIFTKRAGPLGEVLPAHMKVGKIQTAVIKEFYKLPKLEKCNPQTLFLSIMQACQYGLLPGFNNECFLLPYENKGKGTVDCQFQLGYNGLRKMVLQSGNITSLYVETAHQGEFFEEGSGTERYIKHTPDRTKDRTWENLEYAFAVAVYKDGTKQYEVIYKENQQWIKVD